MGACTVSLELYGCTGDAGRGRAVDAGAAVRRDPENGGGAPAGCGGGAYQGVADPAIWDASRGESIYETALKHRIFFVKGDNRRHTRGGCRCTIV